MGALGPILKTALIAGFAAPFISIITNIIGLVGAATFALIKMTRAAAAAAQAAQAAQAAGGGGPSGFGGKGGGKGGDGGKPKKGFLGKFAKRIPGLGLAFAGGYALKALMSGDVTGAGKEVASGAASMIPGVGTAASIGIDAMQYGGISPGGLTLVGEDGPELVTLKPGTKVESNFRTTEKLKSVTRENNSEKTALIERNNKIMNTVAEKIGDLAKQKQNIVL